MSRQRIDPPIPLPEFDPYEQLGKARQRIAELETENERLKSGGCTRDQRTTQFCAEAVALQERIEELEANIDELTARCYSLFPFVPDDMTAGDIRKLRDQMTERLASAEAAEAALERVRGLPEKWRRRGTVSGLKGTGVEDCANELAAALKEETK